MLPSNNFGPMDVIWTQNSFLDEKTPAFTGLLWSGRRESNPRLLLGRQGHYHYATPAMLWPHYATRLRTPTTVSDPFAVRHASSDDLEAIRRIYNEGIEDRVATLEREPKSSDEIAQWWSAHDSRYSVLVATRIGRRYRLGLAKSLFTALRPRERRRSLRIRRQETSRPRGRLRFVDGVGARSRQERLP